MTSIVSSRFLIFVLLIFVISAESQSNQGIGMCQNPLTSLFGKIFHFCENEEKAVKGVKIYKKYVKFIKILIKFKLSSIQPRSVGNIWRLHAKYHKQWVEQLFYVQTKLF